MTFLMFRNRFQILDNRRGAFYQLKIADNLKVGIWVHIRDILAAIYIARGPRYSASIGARAQRGEGGLVQLQPRLHLQGKADP